MKRNKLRLSLALATLLSLQACSTSLLTTFRIALASSGPLVNSLVASGVLNQNQAGPIIADFTDGANIALGLQTDFKVCGIDRACKLTAAQKAEVGFRGIINRQHFGANARVQQIADIADGILSSLVLYYGGGTHVMAATKPLSDSEIEAKIKPQVEQLKALMKP